MWPSCCVAVGECAASWDWRTECIYARETLWNAPLQGGYDVALKCWETVLGSDVVDYVWFVMHAKKLIAASKQITVNYSRRGQTYFPSNEKASQQLTLVYNRRFPVKRGFAPIVIGTVKSDKWPLICQDLPHHCPGFILILTLTIFALGALGLIQTSHISPAAFFSLSAPNRRFIIQLAEIFLSLRNKASPSSGFFRRTQQVIRRLVEQGRDVFPGGEEGHYSFHSEARKNRREGSVCV